MPRQSRRSRPNQAGITDDAMSKVKRSDKWKASSYVGRRCNFLLPLRSSRRSSDLTLASSTM